MKTGVSMGSNIINTRSKKHYAIMNKKDKQKIERAKVCIGCQSNKNSFCSKHRESCFLVNYKCLGIKNPYEYKIPKDNLSNIPKKSKKIKKLMESKRFKKLEGGY